MPEPKILLKELRALCSSFNVYTLCSLETVLYFGDGMTQQEIADQTGQTKQSVQQLEAWMEINGLIQRESNYGKRRRLSYTTAGDDFLTNIRKILCQRKPE